MSWKKYITIKLKLLYLWNFIIYYNFINILNLKDQNKKSLTLYEKKKKNEFENQYFHRVDKQIHKYLYIVRLFYDLTFI